MRRVAGMMLVGMLLFSCRDKQDDILKPDEMRLVLWDVARANSFVNRFVMRDSTKHIEEEQVKYQQRVFDLHKVTRERFYNSYDYYKSHPDQMLVILDTLIKQVNAPVPPANTKFKPVKDN